MRKLWWLILLPLFLTGGCTKRQFVVVNSCRGSWIKVVEGTEELIGRLEYGRSAPLEIQGSAGSTYGRTVELVALGYAVTDGRYLGTSTTSRTISSNGGSTLTPSDLPPWEITSLFGGEGCK